MEQLYHATSPATNIQDASVGAGVLADGRFVDLTALAPARLCGSVALPVEILAVEV
jgi:hypothetical protein